jgi:hypothetical protein
LPDRVLDDVLLPSDSGLVALIRLAREGVVDFGDVWMAADARRWVLAAASALSAGCNPGAKRWLQPRH